MLLAFQFPGRNDRLPLLTVNYLSVNDGFCFPCLYSLPSWERFVCRIYPNALTLFSLKQNGVRHCLPHGAIILFVNLSVLLWTFQRTVLKLSC